MHTFNNISRRNFIGGIASLFLVSPLLKACKPKSKISGKIIEDNSKVGHLLRDGIKVEPKQTIEIPLLIVGAGATGLAASYQLTKNNISDFLLLDLSERHGGNSISDSNLVTYYPWAAHYLPIVNNTNAELLEFLKETGSVTGYDQNNLPVYNEFHLCFDPEERLFINGKWQDGLVPNFGVNDSEKKEIARFFETVHNYRLMNDEEGKPVFEIPLSKASTGKEFKELNSVSFADFLKQKNFTSKHLLWYLNYCCRDDYGSTLNDTSAYAGLHYFCGRKAKASNAESSAVLTWPEGNSFLVNKLYEKCKNNIRTNQLASHVSVNNGKVDVLCFDTKKNEGILYKCDKVILCTPQYINQRILSEEIKSKRVIDDFEYSPWVVANITVTDLPEFDGEPLSWDNVIYNSDSLGYVNACHQHLNRNTNGIVLTYYLPLTKETVKESRKILREKTHEELVAEIISDLDKAHKNIENYITNIDIKLWGHGMIKPKPGFIKSDKNKELSKSIDNQIFFAHTDLSGISIFEEAFDQGMRVANEILNLHDKV